MFDIFCIIASSSHPHYSTNTNLKSKMVSRKFYVCLLVFTTSSILSICKRLWESRMNNFKSFKKLLFRNASFKIGQTNHFRVFPLKGTPCWSDVYCVGGWGLRVWLSLWSIIVIQLPVICKSV